MIPWSRNCMRRAVDSELHTRFYWCGLHDTLVGPISIDKSYWWVYLGRNVRG